MKKRNGFMIGDEYTYEYVNVNAPLEKINYSYAKFNGAEFLKAWERSRMEFLKTKTVPSLSECRGEASQPDWDNQSFVDSSSLFDYWIFSLEKNKRFQDPLMLLLIKRFEVTRKVYSNYSIEMRPENREVLGSMQQFGKLGIVLALLYQNTGRFPALNALLKLVDIILGQPQEAIDFKETTLAVSLECEIVKELIHIKLD